MTIPHDEGAGLTVFVDLDGTLIRSNSFHLFMIHLARGRGMSLAERAGAWSVLARTAAARLAKRIDHAEMKRAVQRAWARLPEARRVGLLQDFMVRLDQTLASGTQRLVEDLRGSGARLVLATAAPREYAAAYAARHGFDDVLATPEGHSEDWRHLLGAEKHSACADLLAGEPGARFWVVTDHLDDLPLICAAERAFIVSGPAMRARIVEALAAAGGDADKLVFLDEHGLRIGGGYWVWFSDQLMGPLPLWEVKTLISKHRHALIYGEDGRWIRCRPGFDFAAAAQREQAPPEPGGDERLLAWLRRRLLRDVLGIYH